MQVNVAVYLPSNKPILSPVFHRGNSQLVTLGAKVILAGTFQRASTLIKPSVLDTLQSFTEFHRILLLISLRIKQFYRLHRYIYTVYC